MTEHSELRRLAEAAESTKAHFHSGIDANQWGQAGLDALMAINQFGLAANPACILALLDEIEQLKRERKWRSVDSAPHEEAVLLGWWQEDGHGGRNWETEVRAYSFGWRRGSISNMSRHGQATHWMPLPKAPSDD